MEASVGDPRARSRPASWHSQGADGPASPRQRPVARGEPARQHPGGSGRELPERRSAASDPAVERGPGVDLHDVMVGEQPEALRCVSRIGLADGPSTDGIATSRSTQQRASIARPARIVAERHDRQRPTLERARDDQRVRPPTRRRSRASAPRRSRPHAAVRPPSGSSAAPIVATTARPARSAPVRTSGSRCGRVSTTTGVLRSPPGSTSPLRSGRAAPARSRSRTPTVTSATAWTDAVGIVLDGDHEGARSARHREAMMPDDDGRGTHGAARAAAEPRRPAPRDVHAAHLRADPRDPRRVPGRQGRQRQAHVRARQGPAAGVRHPAAARRHRRLGHGAGLHHPQGRVLPAGDRVHARGARRPARGRPERRREHPGGAGRPQAAVRRRRRRAGRPRRRAARLGFRCPQRAGDRLRRRRPAPAEGAVRVPHLAGPGGRAAGRRLRDGLPGRPLVPGGPRRRSRRRARLPALPVHG